MTTKEGMMSAGGAVEYIEPYLDLDKPSYY